MTVSLKKIELVVLFVEDLVRAKSFYRDTLGLEIRFEDPDSVFFGLEGASLMVLSIAGAQGLLSEGTVAAQRPSGATSQLVSFVEDMDAIYAELAAKGVEFVREPIDRPWGLRTAHFKDPDGNIWEIAQPLATGSGER